MVYLVREEHRFTEFDAHYFPDPSVPFSRLSEPKNYSGVDEPDGRTVLCAELPCSHEDTIWSMTDEELGSVVRTGLERTGLPIRAAISAVTVHRLAQAYPLFRYGYEESFEAVDEWLLGLSSVLTFGRQGLFVHDNTHHAIYMAQAAAHCLSDDGSFDQAEWARSREMFKSHVVED